MTTVFEQLLEASRGHSDDVNASSPPTNRVDLRCRGLSLACLQRIQHDLRVLERDHLDSGQCLNGLHTTGSATDWQEFSRAQDPLCIKACTLHTGTSFVETMLDAGLSCDPATGGAYFGPGELTTRRMRTGRRRR